MFDVFLVEEGTSDLIFVSCIVLISFRFNSCERDPFLRESSSGLTFGCLEDETPSTFAVYRRSSLFISCWAVFLSGISCLPSFPFCISCLTGLLSICELIIWFCTSGLTGCSSCNSGLTDCPLFLKLDLRLFSGGLGRGAGSWGGFFGEVSFFLSGTFVGGACSGTVLDLQIFICVVLGKSLNILMTSSWSIPRKYVPFTSIIWSPEESNKGRFKPW